MTTRQGEPHHRYSASIDGRPVEVATDAQGLVTPQGDDEAAVADIHGLPPAKAKGGPVATSKPAVAGESGPESITPATPATEG